MKIHSIKLHTVKKLFIAIAVLAIAAIAFAQNRNLCTAAARKEQCPPSAPFFGFMGCAAALVFACLGAAYGTAKSGVGVANMGVLHPDVVMKSIIPVVMAGVLGIYGLIVRAMRYTRTRLSASTPSLETSKSTSARPSN